MSGKGIYQDLLNLHHFAYEMTDQTNREVGEGLFTKCCGPTIG